MLQLEEVAKTYDEMRGLSTTSLTVLPGEILFVSGPNGSGKSTLLGLMVGCLKPTEGGVFWDATPIRRAQVRKGFVPDRFILSGHIRTDRIVECFARDSSEEALSILHDLGIPIGTVGELSSGHQRSALLACALVGNPELLVLDEWDTNLDQAARDLFSALVLKAATAGAACVLSGHHGASELAEVRRVDLENGEVTSDA